MVYHVAETHIAIAEIGNSAPFFKHSRQAPRIYNMELLVVTQAEGVFVGALNQGCLVANMLEVSHLFRWKNTETRENKHLKKHSCGSLSLRHKRVKYRLDHRTTSLSEDFTKAPRPAIPSCFKSGCVWWMQSLSRKTMQGATKQLRMRCQKQNWTRNTTYPVNLNNSSELQKLKIPGLSWSYAKQTNENTWRNLNTSMKFWLSIRRKSTSSGETQAFPDRSNRPLRSQVPRSRSTSSQQQLENWRVPRELTSSSTGTSSNHGSWVNWHEWWALHVVTYSHNLTYGNLYVSNHSS